jgi:hypothetical protein
MWFLNRVKWYMYLCIRLKSFTEKICSSGTGSSQSIKDPLYLPTVLSPSASEPHFLRRKRKSNEQSIWRTIEGFGEYEISLVQGAG